MIQIARARKPDNNDAFDRDCSVYGCEERAAIIIESGGGPDKGSGWRHGLRFCLRHGKEAVSSAMEILGL